MEQLKALNALEPFLALTKSASSPRAAADLITRATSAPNTFLFTELLQAPKIQALAGSADFAAYLTLLQIFSYGTYTTYTSTPNLPALTPPQAIKLRQLSLLALAKDRTLDYTSLTTALALPGPRELEDLVIGAVYAGLIRATLDPAASLVRVDAVAPLRDVAPGAVPDLLAGLRAWAARCDTALADLEAQVAGMRADAARRTEDRLAWDAEMARLLEEDSRGASRGGVGGGGGAEAVEHGARALTLGGGGSGHSRGGAAARYGKRGSGHMDAGAGAAGEFDDEAMDLDDEDVSPDGKKRANKRKLQS